MSPKPRTEPVNPKPGTQPVNPKSSKPVSVESYLRHVSIRFGVYPSDHADTVAVAVTAVNSNQDAIHNQSDNERRSIVIARKVCSCAYGNESKPCMPISTASTDLEAIKLLLLQH